MMKHTRPKVSPQEKTGCHTLNPKKGAVKKCMNNTDITPPPVISTAAGQPPIGKPLIVQARGQLRLTWRLYAESPQSGEISPSHGTGGITVGDLSTQSIMGAVPVCPP